MCKYKCICNVKGQLIENGHVTHTCPATVLEWQKAGKLLAIGWKDGIISIFKY